MSTTPATPEPTTGPETDDQTITPATATEAAETGTDPQDDAPGGDREAAKLRKRAQAAETERDQLTGQLEAVRRAEVERIAAATVANPSALWAAGTEVADLLGEDGTVDPVKVKAATTAAAELLGLARPLGGNYVSSEGGNPRVSTTAGWSDALKR